jgi:hypothetical protein
VPKRGFFAMNDRPEHEQPARRVDRERVHSLFIPVLWFLGGNSATRNLTPERAALANGIAQIGTGMNWAAKLDRRLAYASPRMRAVLVCRSAGCRPDRLRLVRVRRPIDMATSAGVHRRLCESLEAVGRFAQD